MNDKKQQNDDQLNRLYQTRKGQFKTPDSVKFKTPKKNTFHKTNSTYNTNDDTPFWKSWGFYSSLSAFSLVLVIVLPMMNSQFQSDLIISEQAFDPQESLQLLNDSEQFSPDIILSAEPSEKKESQAKQKTQTESMQFSQRKKLDPCIEKKRLVAQRETLKDRITSNDIGKNITTLEAEISESNDCLE
ncbi:hypothetical protein [Marinicellulosiphila megalodicopiae]|uniref:hypothetical protein n=1 Tax=Marinicellulosiphila megalodicopiae TaxID=2724896 RepID=UPI003BB1AF6C